MSDTLWQSPDLDESKVARLNKLMQELGALLPTNTIHFHDEDAVIAMDEMDALKVRIAVRRMLMFHLLQQEVHLHELDDCGDYLTAATDNWATLYTNLFNNDFQNVLEETQRFLTDFDAYPIGGCDGDVRHDLLPDGWEGYDV